MTMNEPDRPDIDMGTIGTGCATGCGTGCLQLLLLGALIAGSGVQLVRGQPLPSGIQFVAFLVGCAGNLFIGYMTARHAPHSKMLHATIVAILLLLLGIVSIQFNPNMKDTHQTVGGLLGFLLSVPLNMLGAHWAISAEEN